jgi:hypothetical protein
MGKGVKAAFKAYYHSRTFDFGATKEDIENT